MKIVVFAFTRNNKSKTGQKIDDKIAFIDVIYIKKAGIPSNIFQKN